MINITRIKKFLRTSVAFVLALSFAFGPLAGLVTIPRAEAAGGTGTSGSPYIIETAQEFVNLINDVDNADAYFRLGNDITLPSNYTTIANFTAYLDGNGHEINGLNKALFNRVRSVEVDLGDGEWEVRGGVIRNLTISGNATLSDTSLYNYGLMARELIDATIENVTATGSLTVTSTSCGSIGGLAGKVEGSTMSNVMVNVDVAAENCLMVGGFIGEFFANDTSKIGSTGSISGKESVGGLVGSAACNLTPGGGIKESFATGNVSGDLNVGGFVGQAEGSECHNLTISDSYARGNVTGGNYTAGFIGTHTADSVTRVYSTGTITAIGAEDSGGLMGSSTQGAVEFSFWDTETSGFANSNGGEGMPTADMKDGYTYTGYLEGNDWNFEDIWSIDEDDNDGYPCLQWSNQSCAFSYQNNPGGNSDLDFTNPTNKTVQTNGTVNIIDLGIIGDGDDSEVLNINLYVNAGTLEFGDDEGLTFVGASTGNNLQFSGTRADINAALETLKFNAPNSTGTVKVEALINGEGGGVVWFTNGHAYKVVTVGGNINWSNAKAAAEGQTFGGVPGYLATITDLAEHEFILTRINQDGWIGSNDLAQEGSWRWVTGPEGLENSGAGQLFWQGNGDTGSVVTYANWNRTNSVNKEPNNGGGDEHCGQIRFTAGANGQWNDLPCGTLLPNYVVEFGAPGALPEVVNTSFDITVMPPEDLVMSNFTPAHQSTNISPRITTLSFTLDKPMTLDAATAYLKKYSTDEEVKEFWGNSQVTISNDGMTITLHLDTILEPNTRYYVEFDDNFAFVTENEQVFGDMRDKDIWNFSTGSLNNGGNSGSSGGSRVTGGGRAATAPVVTTNPTTPLPGTTTAPSTSSDNNTCAADQLLTQDMRAGARDGRTHWYTKTVVKEVKILQGHMNRLGFNSGKIDGILGPITDGAIKRMQVYLGTKADGFVGPITRSLINKSCGQAGLQRS